jgi:putative flippase GtrA
MKRILKQFFQREAHPVVQFIKYGLAGGLATVVDVLVFYFLSWKVFPALTADDAVVKLLGMSIAEID